MKIGEYSIDDEDWNIIYHFIPNMEEVNFNIILNLFFIYNQEKLFKKYYTFIKESNNILSGYDVITTILDEMNVYKYRKTSIYDTYINFYIDIIMESNGRVALIKEMKRYSMDYKRYL